MTAEALASLELPASMLESRLMRRGGVMAVRGLIAPDLLEALRLDFHEQLPNARRCVHAGQNEADWRGGEPARALSSVPCGPLQWTVFGSAAMGGAISELCGLDLEATGAGTYSHYSEPGDFLALHRDIVRCDIAVITCLEEHGEPTARLRAYPQCAAEPLTAVYRHGPRGGVDVVLAPGDTAVMAGGLVPHEVTPLGAGQRRAVTITCFRLR
ncbi:MAG: hypothetical protein SFV51_30620 [Bryobacteraceae bacterium]|nr:hypothetical protein [Bryobacteraceae bacterium]